MPQLSEGLNQRLYHQQDGRERRETLAEDVPMICSHSAALYLFDHVTALTFDPLLPSTSGLITCRYISFSILRIHAFFFSEGRFCSEWPVGEMMSDLLLHTETLFPPHNRRPINVQLIWLQVFSTWDHVTYKAGLVCLKVQASLRDRQTTTFFTRRLLIWLSALAGRDTTFQLGLLNG